MSDIEITDDDIDRIAKELSLDFDEKRRTILKDNRSIDVQACPGSGKTTLLGCKLLLLAKKWKEIDRGVCVLSHTNVAKNEILKVLQTHPAGYKFTKYPHFVGTIQDFVDHFLALPFLRSQGVQVKVVDDEIFFEKFKNSKLGVYNCLNCKGKKQDDYVYNLNYSIDNNGFKIENLDTDEKIKESWKNKIAAVKKSILNEGIVKYREMYNFAFCISNQVGGFLADRFPYVFIDEMQDTQKFQDELLNNIFKETSVMQRFGDPDQSIFSSNSIEKANETYNIKETGEFDYEINDSNRFYNSCKFVELFKVRKNEENPLKATKFRQVKEAKFLTEFNKDREFKHHIILFDNPSSKVLEKYGEIILNEYGEKGKELTHKAVGIVGIEKTEDKDLTIKHYWNDFDKNKTQIKFSPKYFIDVIKLCKTCQKNCYNQFIETCIILLNKNGNIISKSSLMDKLKENGKKDKLNQLFYDCLLNDYPDEEKWNELKQKLLAILGTHDNDFLNYDKFSQADTNKDNAKLNTYKCSNGVKIKVATIHSVKGETHDSTLVLETKLYKYDLSYFLTNQDKNSCHQLKRELDYVGVSRSRHLLCLAIAKSHLNDNMVRKLADAGWIIDNI